MIRKIRRIMCLPIKLYQYVISPSLPPNCRYYPSCSHYALNAIEHYGVFKGLFLTCRRLLKCHPWSQGGYDPVLPNKEKI
jgi:putative membrane protein insertion efficiency factor